MERFVLVADDDPAILKLIKTVVEGEGFLVATAKDGKEAYTALRSGASFAAAIVDVRMPYIEGTDLVKFMLGDKDLSKIPVIMMTAAKNTRDTAAAISTGAIAFLPKPFSNAQLRTTLRTLVGGSEGRSVNQGNS